jgi:hypothetical protein
MNRPIPEPIVNALRQHFPRLLLGDIEGDDVYLLMTDKRGRPHHAVRYIAGPSFMTAVRVCESGLDNLLMLCGETGFRLELLTPAQHEERLRQAASTA